MVTKSSKKNALFVKTRINPLFRPLITDILTHQPKSVVSYTTSSIFLTLNQAQFVVKWMQNKGESIETGIIAALEGLEEEINSNKSSKKELTKVEMVNLALNDTPPPVTPKLEDQPIKVEEQEEVSENQVTSPSQKTLEYKSNVSSTIQSKQTSVKEPTEQSPLQVEKIIVENEYIDLGSHGDKMSSYESENLLITDGFSQSPIFRSETAKKLLPVQPEFGTAQSLSPQGKLFRVNSNLARDPELTITTFSK